MLARWLHQHWLGLRRALHAALLLPALLLLAGSLQHALGPNALEVLMHRTGQMAIYLLAASLAITPLRRLCARVSAALGAAFGKRMADWNWLVRLRRMLGLWCFFYAALHFGLYVWLDAGLDAAALADDLREKPYLGVGMAVLLTLLPLAATSNNASMRRLGGHWKRLHRLSYAAAVMALLHYWWLTKADRLTPLPVTVLMAALLGIRLATRLGWVPSWQGADGDEVTTRTPPPSPGLPPGRTPAPIKST